MMENTSWSTLNGSATSTTPYLHGLKTTAAYSTDYHGITHPSLPNYLAITSGSDQGVCGDCNATGTTSCNSLNCIVAGGCDCPQTAHSIAADLDAAVVTWRAYAESMGTACNTTDSGNYAQRHVPFLYYSDVMSVPGSSTYCAEHVVDYSDLSSDLATSPRRFTYIAPNLIDDMHNPDPTNQTNLPDGDSWLSTQVPNLTSSPAYTDNGLVLIVWDEDDNSGDGILNTDDPIPMYVLSPLAKTGYASSIKANHYSLLATIEDGLGLPRLANAQTATPLADFFPAQ